jgi:hypothetical protein
LLSFFLSFFLSFSLSQIGTTKGTGGDVLILEEAAYCDEGFFYETVAPILSVGSASLVAISTLTSEINFYTRLIKMKDPATGRPLFVTRSIELCCEKCKEDGKSHECVHMLHLVPSWQSQERHRKLHVMMQDRPDLIKSELAGLAFDSLQQVFRKSDIDHMFTTEPLPLVQDQMVWIVVDPAAGGPQSDFAVLSLVRDRGCVTVSGIPTSLTFPPHAMRYPCSHACTNSATDCGEQKNPTTSSCRKSSTNRPIRRAFPSSISSIRVFSPASMFSSR